MDRQPIPSPIIHGPHVALSWDAARGEYRLDAMAHAGCGNYVTSRDDYAEAFDRALAAAEHLGIPVVDFTDPGSG